MLHQISRYRFGLHKSVNKTVKSEFKFGLRRSPTRTVVKQEMEQEEAWVDMQVPE